MRALWPPRGRPVNGRKMPAWCALSRWPAGSASPSRSRSSRSPCRGGRRSRRSRPSTCARCALAGPALGFAILAALTGRDRRPGPWRRVALALVVAVAALGLAVALRGPAGLPAEVRGPLGAGRDDRPRRHRRDRARPALPADRAAGQPALGRRAARARLGSLRAVGGRPRPRRGVARRPRGARGRGRPAAGLDRDRPRRRAGRRSSSASTTPGPARACASAGRGRTGAARRSRRGSLGPPRPAWVWGLTDALALGRGRPRRRSSRGRPPGRRRGVPLRPGP